MEFQLVRLTFLLRALGMFGVKVHSHYTFAFAFASNCNIVSMGCCVKCKESV